MKKILLIPLSIIMIACNTGTDVDRAIIRSSVFMGNAQYIILDECNHISQVWGNAISYGQCYIEKNGWEVIDAHNYYYFGTKNLDDYIFCSDFNEALRYYTNGSHHEWVMDMIDEQMDSCRFYMKQLKSPKRKQKEKCQQAKSTFRALQALYDCAACPSGSYQSYGTDIRRKNDEFMMECRKLDDLYRYEE